MLERGTEFALLLALFVEVGVGSVGERSGGCWSPASERHSAVLGGNEGGILGRARLLLLGLLKHKL